MASLAELMVRVGADISEFTRNMQRVDQSLTDTGRGLMKTGKSISDAGAKMGLAVTAPLLGIATTAVMIGASFDSQMSRVQAIAGATQGEFDKLRAKALELGASTTFSSSEVASAMEELASAGFNTDQILQSTAGVLNLASSAGIGLAEASAIAGNAINGFGLQASDAGHVADVLAKASAISATNATGLGEAFKYVAPVAKGLGISLEETAGAIGILANAGIDGSQAGTTLRMGLLRLASPTKEMTKLMEATGSQFFDSSGKMKNLAGIIDTLKEATKNMTDEQKTNYLATLFGAEAVSGFMVLMDAGSGKINEYANTLKNADGEAQKMADTMKNNLAGAWDNLTGALEALAISFSDVMKGDLQNLANKVTDMVNRFNELSPATKKVIVVIGLLVASIAPLLIVIGMVAQGIGALMILIGAISLPVLAVIAGITALIAVGVLLYMNWDKITDSGHNMLAMLALSMTPIGAIVNGIKLAQQAFSDSIPKIDLFGGKVSENTKKAVTSFMNLNDEATLALNQLNWSGQTVTDQMAQNITGKFTQMKDQVLSALEEQKTKALSTMTNFFAQSSALTDQEEADALAKIQQGYADRSTEVTNGNNRIMEIMNTAKDQKRALTDAEKNEINTIQQQMVHDGISAMTQNQAEQQAIFENMRVQAGNITARQASEVVKNSVDQKNKVVKEANDQYNQTVAEIVRQRDEMKTISSDQADKLIKEAQRQRDETVKKAEDTHAKVVAEAKKQSGDHVNEVNWETGEVLKKWEVAKNDLVKKWGEMTTQAGQKWESMKSDISSKYEEMKSTISSKVDGWKSSLSSKIDEMKSSASSKWSEMKSTASSKFEEVKSAITSPIESAKGVLDGIIGRIQSAFSNMHITIPKPKLPSIDIGTGHKNIAGVDIPYPTFSVHWNAKGGIFNKASILGGGQGVGEAGAEAVIPIQNKRYMKPFASAIAENMRDMGANSGGNTENHFHFAEGAFVVREEADIDKIAQALLDKQKRTNRGGGR